MAANNDAEHALLTMSYNMHGEVILKRDTRRAFKRQISGALEFVNQVACVFSLRNEHVVSIHAMNDELFIWLQGEVKRVQVD